MISQNQPEINDRPECYALYVLMSYNAVVSCDSVLSAGLLNKSDFLSTKLIICSYSQFLPNHDSFGKQSSNLNRIVPTG